MNLPFVSLTEHLAPGRADYEQAFSGLNLITEKISGTLFEISGDLVKELATLKSLRYSFWSLSKCSGTLFEVCGSHSLSPELTIL